MLTTRLINPKWGSSERRANPQLETDSPLNHAGIHLRHPGMPDAPSSTPGHDESVLSGPGDEDLDLEGQEYEAEEYEGEEFPEDGEDEDEELEDEGLALDPHPPGLKEISNLGKFTVSTHKQDNGVEELRSDDLTKLWQYVLLHLPPFLHIEPWREAYRGLDPTARSLTT